MNAAALQVSNPMTSKNAIRVPEIDNPDSGIIVSENPEGIRYKIWYMFGYQKRFVVLPPESDIEEARIRRDNLYANLRKRYRAKTYIPRPESPKRTYTVSLRDDTYIYQQDPWIVRVRGQFIGTAKTQAEAKQMRDQWLADHADSLNLKKAIL